MVVTALMLRKQLTDPFAIDDVPGLRVSTEDVFAESAGVGTSQPRSDWRLKAALRSINQIFGQASFG